MSGEGSDAPEVTVVIPALNAARYIREQLTALAAQDFEGAWEVIVADNGSDDGTDAVVQECRAFLPRLRLVDASHKRGVAAARNAGVREATGRFIAFCDADDVVSPSWLRQITDGGTGSTICYGVMEFFKGCLDRVSTASTESNRPAKLLFAPFRYLPFGNGANLLVERSVLLALDGFDESYGAGEDVDLCWRAQYAGHSLGVAEAVIFYRMRESAWDQFRQYVGYGKGEVHLYRDHAVHGMPRSSFVRAIAVYGWLVVVGCVAALRRDPYYRFWVNAAGRRWGRAVGSWRFRRLYL